MQLIEQFLQKSILPHWSMTHLDFSEFRLFFRFSSFLISTRVKNGQGKTTEASGFREIVVEADEHLITLLNPPKA